jgi:hypothetical protein
MSTSDAATKTHAERVGDLVDEETSQAKSTNPYQKTLEDLERERELCLTSGSTNSPSRLGPSPTNVHVHNRSFSEMLLFVSEWKENSSVDGGDSTSNRQAVEDVIRQKGIKFWDEFRERWVKLPGVGDSEKLAIAYLRYHIATAQGMAPRKKHFYMFSGMGISPEVLETSFTY